MSLNLDGIVKPVPLADGGIYMSSDGTMKSVVRSGRKCLGMIFDLLLGTQTGGLQCQQTMSFGGIVYQDDKEDNINALTLKKPVSISLPRTLYRSSFLYSPRRELKRNITPLLKRAIIPA